jgi:hypothetical protein
MKQTRCYEHLRIPILLSRKKSLRQQNQMAVSSV